MKLETYLGRIGYSGQLQPDRSTLDRLVAAQLLSVPFENLSQQMGIQVSTDVNEIYRKVVLSGRGGWCFELNSLFRWVLQEVGFTVSFLAGYVGQSRPKNDQTPNHMFLRVECGEPMLVDVGFGGGMLSPIPLKPGSMVQQPYTVSITDESGGFFSYSESAQGDDARFWFTLDEVDRRVFDPANEALQTDPMSPFLRTLTAQRRYPGRHVVLRDRVIRTCDSVGVREENLTTSKSLVDSLRYDFGLVVPEISTCWPHILDRSKERSST